MQRARLSIIKANVLLRDSTDKILIFACTGSQPEPKGKMKLKERID